MPVNPLSTIDMLSPKITLYYKQKNKHNSPISGVLTIIAFGFILSFVFIFFLRYIKRENPIAYFFNRYVEDVGIFSFNDSYFFHYVQLLRSGIRDTIEVDFNKIEIIGINSSMQTFLEEGKNLTHWIYGKCDNETKLDGIENLINIGIFGKSACLKKFYNKVKNNYYDINDNNFEWPVIKHGASHINFSFYGVIIRKCTNSSRKNCSSLEEINKYLNNAYLSFNVIDHNIDILNFKNPITKFLYSITNGLTEDSYIINNLNFNPGLIKSYYNTINIFNEKPLEQKAYFFHENSKTTTNSEKTNILGAFFIWMQNSQQYYERRYSKLQDVLSEMGGFANVVMMVAKCINYLIARFNMLSDTQELLTKCIKKNIHIYEKLIRTESLKEFIGENHHQKNEGERSLKLINTGQNNKKIINKENSSDGKDDKKNKIINVINNNNLGEETNRFNNNNENSKENIITEQNLKLKNKGNLKRMSTRNNIKRDFALINKKDKFSCFSYIFYLIFCKQIYSRIKYYEELRRLIISEECMFQNYLNIYRLLELNGLT